MHTCSSFQLMHVFFSVSVQSTYACIAKCKAEKMIVSVSPIGERVSHYKLVLFEHTLLNRRSTGSIDRFKFLLSLHFNDLNPVCGAKFCRKVPCYFQRRLAAARILVHTFRFRSSLRLNCSPLTLCSVKIFRVPN